MSEHLFFRYGCSTDTGLKRKENQDHCDCSLPTAPEVQQAKGFLFAVADGMGGHSGGKTASTQSIEIIKQAYYQSPETFPQKALRQAVKTANEEIYRLGSQNEHLKGMGSTCTVLIVKSEIAYLAHVGDSRAYLINQTGIHQLTTDHSLTGEMVRQGMLTPQAAEKHPERNVLTRAVGVHPEIAIEMLPVEYRPDDIFLLCSDGLYTEVPQRQIWEITRQMEPQAACERLVEMANANGGHDNVTVQIISFAQATEELSTRVLNQELVQKQVLANSPTAEVETINLTAPPSPAGESSPPPKDLTPSHPANWLKRLRKGRTQLHALLQTHPRLVQLIGGIILAGLLLLIFLCEQKSLPNHPLLQRFTTADSIPAPDSILLNRQRLEQHLQQIDDLIVYGYLDSAWSLIETIQRQFSSQINTQAVRQAISKRYLRLGHAARDVGDLFQAKVAYLGALELTPDALEIRELIATTPSRTAQ